MASEVEALIEAVEDDSRDRRRRRDDDDRRRRRDDDYDRDRRRRRDDDHDRDRDRERERDRDSGRRRRDDDRDRDRDRDGGRDRDRDRDREYRRRRGDSREDSLSRLRTHSTRSPPKPELTQEEKLARAIERDKRTVFVSRLHPKTTDFELFDFFSKAGKVRDVRIITDKKGNSKGFAYIEYYDPSSVAGALNLQGMTIRGHQCMVKLSESEKNVQAHLAAQQAAMQQATIKLHVENISPDVTQSILKEVFGHIGPVESISLHHNQGAAGWAHIKYKNQEDAKKAVTSLNGQDLLGKELRIGLVSEGDEEKLDDSVNLTNRGKELLRARLAGQEPPPGGLMPPAVMPPQIGVAPGMVPTHPPLPAGPPPGAPDTTCVHLCNLFDPAEEEEEDFDEDIKEEVAEQCNRVGRLVHIFVDKHSPKGELWLRFSDNEGGRKAYELMHGRWFSKRQIRAEFVPTSIYMQRFPSQG